MTELMKAIAWVIATPILLFVVVALIVKNRRVR
jgi:hypothetical protein